MDVLAYCRRFAGVPFEWGVSDCACFAAGWAREAHGARSVRVPKPATARGRIAYSQGSRLLAAARRWAARAGLREVSRPPREGDIGLVEGADCAGFGIRLGESWAIRSEDGFALVTGGALAVFSGPEA